MEQELIRLAAQAPKTLEQRRPAQRAGSPDDFGAQVAVFYPYAQAVEPALRASSSEQRQRTASVGASSSIGRRRQPREE